MQAGLQKFLPCSFFMILPITFQTKLNIHLIGQEKLKVVKTKKLFITLEIKRRKDALWWLYAYLCILMVKNNKTLNKITAFVYHLWSYVLKRRKLDETDCNRWLWNEWKICWKTTNKYTRWMNWHFWRKYNLVYIFRNSLLNNTFMIVVYVNTCRKEKWHFNIAVPKNIWY